VVPAGEERARAGAAAGFVGPAAHGVVGVAEGFDFGMDASAKTHIPSLRTMRNLCPWLVYFLINRLTISVFA